MRQWELDKFIKKTLMLSVAVYLSRTYGVDIKWITAGGLYD